MSKTGLPQVIMDYFAVSNKIAGADAATFFTNDASVNDEGKTYNGQEDLKK